MYLFSSGRPMLLFSLSCLFASVCFGRWSRGLNFNLLGQNNRSTNLSPCVMGLKVTTRFFQQQPWIIGKIIMIALGSHMPNITTRFIVVPLRWSWLNRKQRRHWIIGTFIMIVLRSHVFSAEFTTVVFWKMITTTKIFIVIFLILYYNKFTKVCGHTPKFTIVIL